MTEERIVELKLKIAEIEEEYQEELDQLKGRIKEINAEINERTDVLNDEYGSLINDYILGNKAPTPKGPLTIRHLRRFRVVDPSIVPAQYWSVNEKLIGDRMSKTKYTEEIPGVEVYTINSLSVKTK